MRRLAPVFVLVLSAVTAQAGETVCENVLQPVSGRSLLFRVVDRAADSANFGSAAKKKSSPAFAVTLLQRCLDASRGAETFTAHFLAEATARSEVATTFTCLTQQRREAESGGAWSAWTTVETRCQVLREPSEQRPGRGGSDPRGGDEGDHHLDPPSGSEPGDYFGDRH
ncbi:MAG: hypothetical protein NDJ90_02550 [Oligoflexia bacterium]|nr:hypothetical protein [Oligoflexia bacterium]